MERSSPKKLFSGRHVLAVAAGGGEPQKWVKESARVEGIRKRKSLAGAGSVGDGSLIGRRADDAGGGIGHVRFRIHVTRS
jgi:hypothetical protein